MSTEHTPGPWTAHSTGLARSGLPEYQIHWSDIGECVAEIVHGTENAKLIAAAPELLEALIECEYMIDHCLFGCDAENAKAKARAAIAKATGEHHEHG
jgi:hypothetical protein